MSTLHKLQVIWPGILSDAPKLAGCIFFARTRFQNLIFHSGMSVKKDKTVCLSSGQPEE